MEEIKIITRTGIFIFNRSKFLCAYRTQSSHNSTKVYFDDFNIIIGVDIEDFVKQFDRQRPGYAN